MTTTTEGGSSAGAAPDLRECCTETDAGWISTLSGSNISQGGLPGGAPAVLLLPWRGMGAP